MKRWWITAATALCSTALLAVGGNYGASVYYAANHGSHCADCHEMADFVSAVHASPHQNATCLDCHEAGLATKLRHARIHLSGSASESIRLRNADIEPMVTHCQKCHQQEYAGWHAGPHSATYQEIFSNPAHNTKRRLMEDCFRCHGMYFEGSIRDVVTPQNTRGPWHLNRRELGDQPTIPCQACHSIHREGAPQSKTTLQAPAAVRRSLAFFDRREGMHFEAAALVIPKLYDGARLLNVSPDSRQALCYQCHAPRAPEADSMAAHEHQGEQAGSGDDRTPVGVHEGLSCLACHNGHDESARASCAACHSKKSRCGPDVETMDTSFANPASTHDIHRVKCADCHEGPKQHVAERR